MSSAPPLPQDLITTVVIDEVHNRSAHSDYVLALTEAAMQKNTDLRLVLMSATGDLPGLAQIFQFCEILQRALDLGWTEMLIPLPFHGQSSTEDVEGVFADPAVLASTGKYPMGQNPNMFDPDSLQKFAAPLGFQEIWAAYRDPRFARSCIVCTNVAESGITNPNVGLVISSGVQRRVSTGIRTGSTVIHFRHCPKHSCSSNSAVLVELTVVSISQ